MKADTTRTLWHRLLGKLLELLLTPVGVSVLVDFPLMSDPPRADILLLRRDTITVQIIPRNLNFLSGAGRNFEPRSVRPT